MSERVRDGLDQRVEAALIEINDRLEGAFESDDAEIDRPVVLLVGHQRSGTTLVYQYLASRFELGYPSNLVARFFRAPVAGIYLERSLARHLGPLSSSFRSQLGTTESVREPHEFSYFWNHWFPESRVCRDPAGFVRVLANMQQALDAPLLFKNVFNTLRVGVLAELLPTALFVRVRRDFVDLACSTLDSRRHRFGDDSAWFGVEPDQRAELAELEPAAQIAAQIHHTESALAADLAALPPERVFDCPYDAFCADPTRVTEPLASWLDPRDADDVPRAFATRRTAAGHPDADRLRAALEAYFSSDELAEGRRTNAAATSASSPSDHSQ